MNWARRKLTLKLQDESGLKIWKTWGQDDYQKRKKILQKQLEKISKPKLRIRERIAPPNPLFKIGDLVEYRTSGGEIRRLLLIETSQKGKTFLYALAPLKFDAAIELNSKSISKAEFVGHKISYSFGLAVTLLDHRIVTSYQNRFQTRLNVAIDSKNARIGSFGGIVSIDGFENEMTRVLDDHKVFGNSILNWS